MALIPPLSLRLSKKALLAGVLALALVLVLWGNSESSDFSIFRNIPSFSIERTSFSSPGEDSLCPLEAEYLRGHRFGLSDDIIFQRQCIRATTSDTIDRDSVADLSYSLLGERQNLNLVSGCHKWEPMPCEPIELQVPPAFPKRKYPELLFGVATSFARLLDSAEPLAHWLGNTGARLVAIVVDAAEFKADLGRLLMTYRELGVEIIIVMPQYSELGVNEQHFTIIRDLLHHATPETKWLGIIDDDTFFPSLHPLAEILEDQNHTEPAYLGGLSDSMKNFQQYGLMAYGGAGVFLSIPLAEQLEPNIDKCLAQRNTHDGDALLKSCIYSETEARLAVVPGLNQLDIHGDAAGFYESGPSPLSLHHWKTWHLAPVEQMAKSTDFCGSCFLQRWRFGGKTVLTNGYSVVVYKDGIELEDLNKTEGTFNEPDKFEWSYGPLRPKLGMDKKKSFTLVDAEMFGDRLRQVYVKRGRKREKEPDEVLELWWEKAVVEEQEVMP